MKIIANVTNYQVINHHVHENMSKAKEIYIKKIDEETKKLVLNYNTLKLTRHWIGVYDDKVLEIKNNLSNINNTNDIACLSIHTVEKFKYLTDNLHNDIIKLSCLDDFDSKINNLPQKIMHIKLGQVFNEQINYLPASIIVIDIGYDFDQPVNNFPNNVTRLTFVCQFDRKVNKLPIKMAHMSFGLYFNQKVNKLPRTITFLSFAQPFNYPLDNISDNIQKIILMTEYKHDIPEKLKNKIKYRRTWIKKRRRRNKNKN